MRTDGWADRQAQQSQWGIPRFTLTTRLTTFVATGVPVWKFRPFGFLFFSIGARTTLKWQPSKSLFFTSQDQIALKQELSDLISKRSLQMHVSGFKKFLVSAISTSNKSCGHPSVAISAGRLSGPDAEDALLHPGSSNNRHFRHPSRPKDPIVKCLLGVMHTQGAH